ncbi:MAG: pentapeptide repeat-containing protein [Elainellaceae cyanobacterium]
MRERFKQRQPKERIAKRWIIGAIATPTLLWMVWWLPPGRSLQPDGDRLSHSKTTLTHPYRAALISDLGMIAAIAGGVFLLLNFCTAKRNAENIDLSNADFSGADLNGAGFGGANLSGANLSGANLVSADINGADLSRANLRYANLSGANFRYSNLSRADLKYANLSGADLNCALLTDANLSEANLSGALLFFTNSRDVLNLEPLQLKAKPSPFLCHVALPAYSQQPAVNPNRDCARIPQLLSDRYDISLEEAQGIVDEARQHPWD